MAEGEIRIRDQATGRMAIGTGAVPAGYDLIGPASAPPPPSKTIRLQSVIDPSVIIEGPAGKPFDVRAWQPVGTSVAAPAASPGPSTVRARPSVGPLSDFADAASAVADLPFNVPFSGAAPPREVMEEAPSTILQGALPMTGAAAGTAVAGPAGTVFGAMAGEGVNQYLGITPADPSTIILNGVLPKAGELLGRITNGAARWMGARLPGASPTLHEMAAEQLGKIPGAIQPTATAESLYKIADGFSPRIEMPGLIATADKVLSREQQAAAGLKLPGLTKTAESLQSAAQGGMPFQDVRVNLRRVGDKIRELRDTGGEELGAYKQMWRAMMDDMEAAAASGSPAEPAVQALKAANAAMKREYAAEELGDILTKRALAIRGDLGFMRNGEPQVQVNFNKALKEIKVSEDIKKSLTPKEYGDLIKDLTVMAQSIPVLPSQAGANVGSRALNLRAYTGVGLGTSAGAVAGTWAGFGPVLGTTVGGGLGLVAGAAGPTILGKLLVSEGGRRFLHGVLSGTGGVITPQAMSILATAVGNTPPARDTAAQLGDLGRQYMTTGGE